jgi:hypothetical protein
MKYFLFLILIFCTAANAYGTKAYKSILVIGHLYTLYQISGDGAKDKIEYIDKDNLGILSNEINKIERVEKVILLGDTYVDDRESIYELVYSELIEKIKSSVVVIHANHEVYNMSRFIKSGGLKRAIFDIKDFRFLLYSPWRLRNGLPKLIVTEDDIGFFKNNLDQSKQNIVLVTDMVHHNNTDISGWKSDIVPILNQYKVNYVVVGDNDQIQHRYSWVKVDKITYIHQGMAQNYHAPNINTYLEIQLYDDGNIKFVPHIVPLDGLSSVYESSLVDYIKPEKLSFFERFYLLLKRAYRTLFLN